jgi:hypothetical protein
MRRQCMGRTPTGQPCQSPPLHDSEYCLMHSPEHKQEVQEARRLGGMRHKREVTVAGAYDIESINTIEGIRRLIEIAMLDTLSMDNSLSRNRTLAYLAMVALKTLEMGEFEERLAALEQSVHPSNVPSAPTVFDVETKLLETNEKEET